MVYTMSSAGLPQTRTHILEAARAMFEERGYYGGGLGALAATAGGSRPATHLPPRRPPPTADARPRGGSRDVRGARLLRRRPRRHRDDGGRFPPSDLPAF